MNVNVCKGELYPHWSFYPDLGGFTHSLEVDPITLLKWERIEREFFEMQEEIAEKAEVKKT